MRHWQKSSESSSHPVVFNSLQSISDDAKVSEAMDILIAGADTTASTLTTGFIHILSNPSIKARLVQAIDEAMPEDESSISLQSLEKVEYLVCEDDTEGAAFVFCFEISRADNSLDCLCKRIN